MIAVVKEPLCVEETRAAAARPQERTPPAQDAAPAARAERLLDGLFTVEIHLDRELMVAIAIRERFVPARVKRAVLTAATRKLIDDPAAAWSVHRRAAPAHFTASGAEILHPSGAPRRP